MLTKIFQTIKQIGESSIQFVFSTLNVKDLDDDVTLPGAFGVQDVLMVPTHNWMSVPLGKGKTSEVGNEAIAEIRFNMESTTAREWHSALKFDFENGKPLYQYSYAFDILKESRGEFEGEPVRFLEGLRVHEVSPVLLGAGINTRTLGVKLKLQDHFDFLEEALEESRILLGRIDDVTGMRVKEGRTLSHVSRERLNHLLSTISDIRSDIEAFLAETDSDDDGKAAQLFAQYQKTMLEFREVLRT